MVYTVRASMRVSFWIPALQLLAQFGRNFRVTASWTVARVQVTIFFLSVMRLI